MVGPGHRPHHAGLVRPVFPGMSDGAPPGAMDQALPIRVTAWYRKSEATFSDVLARVSRVFWAEKYLLSSAPHWITSQVSEFTTTTELASGMS